MLKLTKTSNIVFRLILAQECSAVTII